MGTNGRNGFRRSRRRRRGRITRRKSNQQNNPEPQIKIEQQQQPTEQQAMPTSSKGTDPKPEPRRGERSRHKTEFYGHNVMITQFEKSPEKAAKELEA